MSKEAMKLALEVLKNTRECDAVSHAIKALEEALAKQEPQIEDKSGYDLLGSPFPQEPVEITISGKLGNIYSFTGDYSLKKGDKVYTTPQQRKPLTDEEIEKCYETTGHYQTLRPQDRFAVFALARAIEAAHNIKE